MTETLSSRETYAVADTLDFMSRLKVARLIPPHSDTEKRRTIAAFRILKDLEIRHGFTLIETSELNRLKAAAEETLNAADASDGDAGGETDCACVPATLEAVFRPHEVLVGALDTLSEVGVVTIESDIDVVAARLLAALDDVGATVVHYDDTDPDDRPRDIPPEDLWLTCIRLLNKQMADRIEKKCSDDVSAFDIPNIPSQPWWTVRDLDRYRAWLSESPANAWDMGGINVQTGGRK